MTPEDIKERQVKAFLQLALEEKDAGATLRSTNPRQAAYFLQQAVEKLVRATLEHAEVPAGPTHSIRALTDLLPQEHKLRELFLAFDDWNAAATRFRYPSSVGKVAEISPQEIELRLSAATTLATEVLNFLGGRSA